MKRLVAADVIEPRASLPSRERGLKLDFKLDYCRYIDVAPLAGAWIETPGLGRLWDHRAVAPLAGAWIETNDKPGNAPCQNSRSPRGSVD